MGKVMIFTIEAIGVAYCETKPMTKSDERIPGEARRNEPNPYIILIMYPHDIPRSFKQIYP